MLTNERSNNNYASLLADGKFHVTVENPPEDKEEMAAWREKNPDAVLRKYETSDKQKGEKWENTYDTLTGTIKAVFFFDGEYGKSLHIVIDEVELSLNVDSNFASDFMKKLPSINVKLPIKMGGYSFADSKTGKTRRGISIVQNEGKIKDFFWDAEKKENLHDFPQPDGDADKFTKEDWKIYFLIVTKFLVNYTTENHLIEKAAPEKTQEEKDFDGDDSEKEEETAPSAPNEAPKEETKA